MNFLDFLGPIQQAQSSVQIPHDELFSSLEILNTPQNFIEFKKKIIQNLQIIPSNKFKKDSFSKNLFDEELVSYGTLQIHKIFFEFLKKKDIYYNPFQDAFPMPIPGKRISKGEFVLLLKDELHELFQAMLDTCKFEDIINIHTSKHDLELRWLEFVYWLGGLYFLDFLECFEKINGLKKTCKVLYDTAVEENEFIEYDKDLLQNVYKKLINTENILGLGIVENLNPDTCVHLIQKKI